jgi:hypothetical protein
MSPFSGLRKSVYSLAPKKLIYQPRLKALKAWGVLKRKCK